LQRKEFSMTFAITGIVGWLLSLAVAMCLGSAAKRGDEFAAAALRCSPEPAKDAEIIPFDRARFATEK
jgi:hypothetical protein